MNLIRADIYENLRMSLFTLGSHKLRSLLTVVGIVLGVWTVMAIASIISGIDVGVKKEIESWGTRTIRVGKFAQGVRLVRMTREERARKDLTYEDAIALSQLSTVEAAVPFLDVSTDYVGRKLIVTHNGKDSANIRIMGTLPEYERIGNRVISEGRYFTRFENETKQDVCLIGSSVADNFFLYGSAIEQTIEAGNRRFRIVGVLEKREQFGGGSGDKDQNNVILVPYEVARQMKPNATDVSIVAMARTGMIEQAKDQITDLLRVRRQVPFGQPDNFALSTAESVISNFRAITTGIAIAMVVISSVGLVVGGIGVMNMMLVSVSERTREIGIRKAIGARRRDIMWQFLFEAMVLTGTGGLIGLVIGWLTTLLIRIFLPSYLPMWAPVAGLTFSLGIGMVFGMWPALKAARLDPIEALRYE
ncbi:MAG TPA: ABC transporter permease [Pyrinomonadaceae bacterium]|nr:ABC transporter permease [Pyrinomonadaceae bacterium]